MHLIETEHEKLKSFWCDQRERLDTLQCTPQFRRMLNGDVRGIDLRHIHDRLGWAAKNDILCIGALYRTEAFIQLRDEERCGNKRSGQTVHIEHTVPISTMVSQLRGLKPTRFSETLKWILRWSVVTAVRDGAGQERHTMVRKGQSRSTNIFNVNHCDFQRPFRRYDDKKHSQLWDIVNVREIDHEKFSIADHVANIATVLKWAGREDLSLSPLPGRGLSSHRPPALPRP